MFTLLPRLRPAAAPLVAVLMGFSLFLLEGRHFDANSSLLLGLLVALAVAEMIPVAALGFTGGLLVLQVTGVFVPVLAAGVSGNLAVPLVVFFATLGWTPKRSRWVLPGTAVVFASAITTGWFRDEGWINYLFGSDLYGRGALQSVTYGFLVFGAFCALHLAAWAAGVAVNAASASSKAQARAEARLKATELDLALEQERNRIAVELHDVLAHSLAVIVAQAEGIRYIHRVEPEAVEGSAAVIADAARQALLETRALLEGISPQGPVGAVTRVDRIEELVERFSASGMPVTVSSSGDPRNSGQELDVIMYRLIQEALTNAFKHADRAAGAKLTTEWTDDGVTVQVSSSLHSQDSATLHPEMRTGGRGLGGIRSRATPGASNSTVSRPQAAPGASNSTVSRPQAAPEGARP